MRSVRDPWHVGELPGDRGMTVRDQNGLTVCRGRSAAETLRLVTRHNLREERRERDRGGVLNR